MEKVKKKILDLLHNNKSYFIFLSARLAVSFLLFISMFFTFFKVFQSFDVNQIQPTEFPGAILFILLLVILPLASIMLLLIENTKYVKTINYAHSIISTIFFLWGIILFFATKSEAAGITNTEVRLSFGFLIQLLLIGYLWAILLGEQKLIALFDKYFIPASIKSEKTT